MSTMIAQDNSILPNACTISTPAKLSAERTAPTIGDATTTNFLILTSVYLSSANLSAGNTGIKKPSIAMKNAETKV